jgi:hypothetical protein
LKVSPRFTVPDSTAIDEVLTRQLTRF